MFPCPPQGRPGGAGSPSFPGLAAALSRGRVGEIAEFVSRTERLEVRILTCKGAAGIQRMAWPGSSAFGESPSDASATDMM